MGELSRREVIAAGAAAGALVALDRTGIALAGAREPRVVERLDFSVLGDGDGWGRHWRTASVANLRRAGGEGLLEAGSDVFPNDPRPVAFAVDRRILDGKISVTLTRTGSATGVVLRRSSQTSYYAAVYDSERGALRILRRNGAELEELASTPVAAEAPLTLSLEASGRSPTTLIARLGVVVVDAEDGDRKLQRAGDAGVLATAQTLFPSDSNPVLPALGNLHLLPWAVQEGQAVMETPAGQGVIDEIRRRSTAGFRLIEISTADRARTTAPSVIAATTGRPVAGGAELHVAADLAARATIELSYSRDFRKSRRIAAGKTDDFQAVTKTVKGLKPGRRVYWRARLLREGRRVTGPTRSFRVPPVKTGARPFRIAVASCGTQFGPLFDHLAAAKPDVFIWQGDLNYPDTHGPLAQTMPGYAGIWRDFLANPLLTPLLERTAFAPQRDDHDYAVQDANSTNVADFPWGLTPWESLMNGRAYYSFAAGAAEVWVLDQRLHKSDPATPATLLGARQRRWLFDGLRRSKSEFKVICSPCTVFIGGNSRDGNWSNAFGAERDLLLEHVRENVKGKTIFLTGDTHLTGVYENGDKLEVRAAPVGIPKPNDITLVDPLAAQNLRAEPNIQYAGDECHFTLLEVNDGLDLKLVREDGATPYERRFKASRAGRRQAR